MPANNFTLLILSALLAAVVACKDNTATPTAAQSRATGKTTFQIIDRSNLPPAATNPYPDCLFSAKVKMTDGTFAFVNLPGFLDRKPQPAAALKPGDTVSASLVPLDQAPEDIQRLQIADKFADFVLPQYYSPNIRIIESSKIAVSPSPESIPTIPPQRYLRPSKQDAYSVQRQRRIDTEKQRIRNLLDQNGGSWEKWRHQITPIEKQLKERADQAGGFLKSGPHFFRSIPSKVFRELCDDDIHLGPIGMLRLLNAELARIGIDLIVVPFPEKEIVNLTQFDPNLPSDIVAVPDRLRLHLQLLEHDIEVIDLAPALRAALDEHDQVFMPSSDPHPLHGGIAVTSLAIAERLKDYGIGNATMMPSFITETQQFTIADSSAEDLSETGPFTAVRALPPPNFTPQTPTYMLAGDSFLHVPYRYVKDASIPSHVAAYAGGQGAKIVQEGGSNHLLVSLARRPKETFQNQRVCFFVFGPRRFRASHQLTEEIYHWLPALLPH
ncbi:hypothetical protein FEM03_03200 [Phragmitibacter flavus]|uniref:AlgX/AlgJ SGNH hydrolase-like domain-containing protein n=1 Tax=Phragmitibacter flavus TaxID=2576071 RepID=A0A5R8KJ62_9BACT|nr:hypothetical protein [Phragmitibacter flavus]TLD72378.1 hypothetical protein FEM03_03200 [Phragmitibacter flavus]